MPVYAENSISDGADLLAELLCKNSALLDVLCMRIILHLLLGMLTLFSNCLPDSCSDKQTAKPWELPHFSHMFLAAFSLVSFFSCLDKEHC